MFFNDLNNFEDTGTYFENYLLGFSDVILVILLGLWVWRRLTTEINCHSFTSYQWCISCMTIDLNINHLRQYWLVSTVKLLFSPFFILYFLKDVLWKTHLKEWGVILFPEGEGVYRKYVDLSPLVICLLSPTGMCGNGELY